ncbi:unnamed protein product [Arabidopsis arenosa]|uniref:Uncharacterized protein n=1 Tax=Arabidopsis arenosa TaxID=38785 RepID=A0A8S1ZH90_ARAAE|nr:unnamed protein product [Arabidopsis arenosa]
MPETKWYYTREEIEKISPSRLDGINFKEETFQRWFYTSFLQELGQRLNNPQKSIATAIVLCQRFFTRQSLAKNDPKTVAIISVERCVREIEEECVNRRELEKLVLSTLGFDLEIEHPYKLVMDWVKRSVKTEDVRRLCQASFNFVNDSLRTSLCLQFGPSQIAAAAIYIGSSMCKMKLPCDGEKEWWREFDVTKRQLWEICDQTLDLYIQDFVIPVARGDCKQIKNDVTKPCQGLQDYKGICQT